MDRRTALKGIAAVLVAPTPAALGENIGMTKINALINKCLALKASAEAADHRASSIWTDPARPDTAHVLASEFRPVNWPLREDRFHTLLAIDKVINRHDDGQRRMLKWIHDGDDTRDAAASAAIDAEYARRFKASQDERAKLHALYAARKGVYEQWAISSGYRAAEDEASGLWRQKYEIEHQILAFKCQTIEDVRAKAGYVMAEYGDEFSQEAATKFIAGLVE